MAKMMKKAADGYTSYGAKASKPSPVTDYAGKTSKPDSYTQYRKGGVVKKAQNGIAKMAKKDPKEAAKRPMGMNFDKKSFDSVKSYDSLIKTKTKPKAKNGTSFGMLSVKAGVDKNPNPTAADRIAGAKKKAKFGKKMQYGGEAASMVPTMKKGGKAMYGKSMMSKGGKMKSGGKCKNGC
jgi:hypothetical protein